uniref:Ysc84 actin-binding domain-containing protein n=1 Tax=Peronospora matthiolae TaxID=2874970 RepID=A0AAV1UPM9_9STRA
MPLHMPYHSTMDKEITKAASILDSCFRSTVSADAAIPAELIQTAAGLAFLTVVKAGMIWTGKMGTGLVIARLEDGSWSPPSGIGTAGMGFGAEIGGEIIDFLIILGSPRAVKTFKRGTQVSVGAGLDLAIGPVGRTAGASVNAGGGGVSGNYTYSHAKGAFAGVGLHGSTFMVRGEMNSQFYGRKVTPNEILSGQAAPPPGSCDVLYDAIRRASQQQGLGGRRPSTFLGSNDAGYANSYRGSNGMPDAADHAAAARASLTAGSSSSFRGSSYTSGSNSYHAHNETPGAADHAAAARASYEASGPSPRLSSNRESQMAASSTSRPLPVASAVQPDPNDPRLKRYSTYKTERELYAQFEQQRRGIPASVPTESTHSHPTDPSLKYKSYPAPAPNTTYTAPPQAEAMYNSFVKPSVPKAPQQPVPPLPPPAKGAEMKQVYAEVINFVQTKCPYADLQLFKDNCRLFGQDTMSLAAYFSYLLSICSHSLLKELVPQLVRLLPTQEKREHVWTLYVREVLLINI